MGGTKTSLTIATVHENLHRELHPDEYPNESADSLLPCNRIDDGEESKKEWEEGHASHE